MLFPTPKQNVEDELGRADIACAVQPFRAERLAPLMNSGPLTALALLLASSVGSYERTRCRVESLRF